MQQTYSRIVLHCVAVFLGLWYSEGDADDWRGQMLH